MGLSVTVEVDDYEEPAEAKASIFERIGYTGLFKVVWQATPNLSVLTLPYGLWVYGAFLRQSSNLRELLRLHDYACHVSWVYRSFRPRYYRAATALKKYGIS